MKTKEIKELTDKELLEWIDNETVHYTKLRLNHAISPLDNPNQIKETRRNIARLKTELRQRQFAEKTSK